MGVISIFSVFTPRAAATAMASSTEAAELVA